MGSVGIPAAVRVATLINDDDLARSRGFVVGVNVITSCNVDSII